MSLEGYPCRCWVSARVCTPRLPGPTYFTCPCVCTQLCPTQSAGSVWHDVWVGTGPCSEESVSDDGPRGERVRPPCRTVRDSLLLTHGLGMCRGHWAHCAQLFQGPKEQKQKPPGRGALPSLHRALGTEGTLRLMAWAALHISDLGLGTPGGGAGHQMPALGSARLSGLELNSCLLCSDLCCASQLRQCPSRRAWARLSTGCGAAVVFCSGAASVLAQAQQRVSG